MRTWAKIVVGAFAALVLMCIIAGFLLVQSGAWERIRDVGGGIFGIAQTAKGLEALNARFPFQEPPDGAIPEKRLTAFIEVREALKPVVGPYDEWMRTHEGKQGDLRDAKEALQMTTGVMGGLKKSLEDRGMSPREYAWLDRKVEAAMVLVRAGSATETERELLDTLRSVAANPRLSPAEREAIRAKIEAAEKRVGASGGPQTPDAELCTRYRRELDASQLGEFGGMMVRSFAQADKGPRGRHRRR